MLLEQDTMSIEELMKGVSDIIMSDDTNYCSSLSLELNAAIDTDVKNLFPITEEDCETCESGGLVGKCDICRIINQRVRSAVLDQFHVNAAWNYGPIQAIRYIPSHGDYLVYVSTDEQWKREPFAPGLIEYKVEQKELKSVSR